AQGLARPGGHRPPHRRPPGRGRTARAGGAAGHRHRTAGGAVPGRDDPRGKRGPARAHLAAPGPAMTEGTASLTHLLGRLEVVTRRTGSAVEWRRAGDPNPGDPFRGLHISPAQVRALLEGGPAPTPLDAGASDRHRQVEAEADAA